MASGGMQESEAFFVFGGGLLSLVWGEVPRLSAMLERPSLLFGGVSSFRQASMPPRKAEEVPADPEREEGPPVGRESPSAPVQSTSRKKDG